MRKNLACTTHDLKRWKKNHAVDDDVIWTHCHDMIAQYLLDVGFYDASRKDQSGASVTKKLDEIKCYECKQYGHYADKCPKKQKKKNVEASRKPEAWLC